MKKEESIAVKEVDVVLEVIKKYLDQKKDMPVEVLKEILKELMVVKEEYNKTIDNMMVCNSLAVRFERLCDIVGTISTISVEDEDKFDQMITSLENCVESINNWEIVLAV